MEITLLIFNRNDNDNLINLVKDLYDYVQHIVLVDSSDEDKRQEIIEFSKRMGKIKYLYVAPLGYPDLLRKWAYRKSPSDWILLIDTDERINEEFKKDIGKIVVSNEADVYGIWRYPISDPESKKKKIRTLQIRLFNKNFVEETGIVHELPIIKGRFKVLDEKYYMIHLHREMGREDEYRRLEIFDRYSYCTLPERFKKIIKILHLGGKMDCDKEITNLDYFLFFFFKEIYSSIITRDFRRFIFSFKNSLTKLERIKRMRTEEDGDENFEISRIIRKNGIIEFLNLDDDNTIEEINKNYTDLKGSELLIRLLKERYRKFKS
ncbi:MAG: glycosyltransferase [Thermoplasmata archaeon]